MTKVMTATLLILSVAAPALAGISIEQAKINYSACAQQDPYWVQNFGSAIVGFDYKTANAACAAQYMAMYTLQAVGCKVNGQRAVAGYACSALGGM